MPSGDDLVVVRLGPFVLVIGLNTPWSCAGITSRSLSSKDFSVRNAPCSLFAEEKESLNNSRIPLIQSGFRRNEQRVRAAISLTCQIGLPR